jgi:hypothetical protein
MTIKEWRDGLRRHDREDVEGFIDAINTLLNWNDFFTEFGDDMRALRTILEIERVKRAMAERGEKI